MADPRLFLCGGVPPAAAPRSFRADAARTDLCLGEGDHDVHLYAGRLRELFGTRFGAAAADLLEVAAYVYTADQMVSRGGVREFDYGTRWRRDLRFVIPVRAPDVWARPAVGAALRDALEFLGDDQYQFRFVRADRAADPAGYLTDELDPGAGSEFEEVVLFSGGLDSLGGAVDEVLAGQRRVALVSHRPVSTTAARQTRLVRAIRDRLPRPDLRPLHVAVEVNKRRDLAGDFTQRPRSFLFAAVAAVVARQLGLRRFRFYENGVTSLNLPVSGELVGARASRTTHPQTLARFGRLFSLLFDADFTVQNPYQWRTKADVLATLRARGHADLCRLTCSCVHTMTRTERHPHCGRCSQCVDRRLSAVAAGLAADDDPAGGYESDVLTGERAGAELTYAERYTGFAVEFEEVQTAREFAARYPQVGAALPHLGVPAEDGLRRLFDLYRRHAQGIRGALRAVVRDQAEAVVRQTIPPHSLLGVVLGRAPAARAEDRVRAAGRAGAAGWAVDPARFTVTWGDGPACELGNTVEFRLAERLIRARDEYVRVAALIADVWGGQKVEKNTVQRTVSNLRRRFADMGWAAVAIDGRQRDHYRLVQTEAASSAPTP